MKPDKKSEKAKIREKQPKNKGNNKILIIAVAAILLIGGYILLSGTQQKVENTKTLKEVRELIDSQYGSLAPGTETPPVRDDFIPVLAPRKVDKLPDYAVTNAMTLKAYTYATEHPEVLEQIPCYCGCGQHGSKASEGQPHRSVRDCFISDNGNYDDHASYCDTCVGIAMKAQSYFPDGVLIPGSSLAQSTTSQFPETTIDLSSLSLPDNFKSIADGLMQTPAGVQTAYFVNTKILSGTQIEEKYLVDKVEPDSFYGKKIIGMFSADFPADSATLSWIEMHDLGYDSRNDTSLKVKNEPGMKNIVNIRPIIYGQSKNVDNVLKLMNDPSGIPNSLSRFKPLLDSVDNQNAAFEQVNEESNKFSDISYMGITPSSIDLELVKAYRIIDEKSIPSGFSKYSPETKGNILLIKIKGDMQKIQTESDNIDAVART
ncbi:MAG: hypothetical protein OIN87_11755 [Candidatus Methanoperedens sp.]|nr:hypothetical protein [Candidatus Methanoperedens sp.]